MTHGDQTVDVKGFFQPVRSKSWQSLVNADTPLGQVSRKQYIYMGPVDVETAEGDLLTVGQKQYLLRRVEQYYYGDAAVYTWAMCIEKDVNETWASQS